MGFLKDAHLKSFLEDEYSVKIYKRFGALLVVKDGIIIDYFFTILEVRKFLESKPNFTELLIERGIPEKLRIKWEKHQIADGPEEETVVYDDSYIFDESIEKKEDE